MNFQHTEDRRMLADSLNRYIAQEYGFEQRSAIATSEQGYSQEKLRQFAELGVIGALFTEEQGGYGGQGFDISTVFECFGRGLVVEPIMESALLAGTVLLEAQEADQQGLVEEIIAGSAVVAFAHFEPESGFHPSFVQTTATQTENGWVLNGQKSNLYQAQSASAYVVSARVSGADDDEQGIALFLLEPGLDGVSQQVQAAIDGGQIVNLTLEQVQVPAKALLVGTDKAAATIERALGKGVLALCAQAVGAMDIVLESTVEYLRTRKQFGVPLGSFQALQHRVATMLIEMEQARSALINASAAIDEPDRANRERQLSAAKYLIGTVSTLVAEESVQLHGGVGVTDELPLTHYVKRLVMLEHELGDTAFHLARFVQFKED